MFAPLKPLWHPLTMKNPILEEIWRGREKHAAKFNFDPHAIAADLRKQEVGNPNLVAPSIRRRRRKKAV